MSVEHGLYHGSKPKVKVFDESDPGLIRLSFEEFGEIDQAVADGVIPRELASVITSQLADSGRLSHHGVFFGRVDLCWEGMENWLKFGSAMVQIKIPSWVITRSA